MNGPGGRTILTQLTAFIAQLDSSGTVHWTRKRLAAPAAPEALARADELPGELLDLYAVMDGCELEWQVGLDGSLVGGALMIPPLSENFGGFDGYGLEVEGVVRLLDVAPRCRRERYAALWVGSGADGLLIYDGNYVYPAGSAAAVISAGVERMFRPGWLFDLVGNPSQLQARASKVARAGGLSK